MKLIIENNIFLITRDTVINKDQEVLRNDFAF